MNWFLFSSSIFWTWNWINRVIYISVLLHEYVNRISSWNRFFVTLFHFLLLLRKHTLGWCKALWSNMMLCSIVDRCSIIWSCITIEWLNMVSVENLRFLIKRFEIKLFKVCIFIFGGTSFISASVVYLAALSLLATFNGKFFATVWSIALLFNRKSSFGIVDTWLLKWNHMWVNDIKVLR